jgi:hypothetical protein
MSNILVNTIKDTGNNTLLSSDGSGNISSGGAITNTPAFEAYLSATQTPTNNANTKVQFNTERLDTNGYYDNSTNYRFTPLVAGKYFVYLKLYTYSQTADSLTITAAKIYKNGSEYARSTFHPTTVGYEFTPVVVANIDMNGSTDYIEAYINMGVSTGNPLVWNEYNSSVFGAYRIIGA